LILPGKDIDEKTETDTSTYGKDYFINNDISGSFLDLVRLTDVALRAAYNRLVLS
jgi:hypothetical protein